MVFDIWALHPSKEVISSLKTFQKLKQSYPNEKMREQFTKLQQKYQYRAILGDGNCFYRAFAFMYLLSIKLDNFEQIFEQVPLICENMPIDIENINFYNCMQYLWEVYLKPISIIQNKSTKESQLQKLFNEYWLFDILMIAYLRSLNFYYVKKNQKKYTPYLSQGLKEQLKKIATFGQQSQGVQLMSLPNHFDLELNILFVNETILQDIVFNSKGKPQQLSMFFRPGHYDLIYPTNNNLQKSIQIQIPLINSLRKQNHRVLLRKFSQIAKNSQIRGQKIDQNKPIILNQQQIKISSKLKKGVSITNDNIKIRANLKTISNNNNLNDDKIQYQSQEVFCNCFD